MSSQKPTCRTCRSFHRIDDTCHLNPPHVSIVMIPDIQTESFTPATFCAFPSTQQHEWCSQHEEASVIALPSSVLSH